ncbi:MULTISPECIES: hypothetical protein [Frankia]|uniref:hypothetical protein n=1 Tax=Frankia TaxID=1854 RepID=UPI00138B1572|nr:MULTISPECIES: hypothetical protein [Frankia]
MSQRHIQFESNIQRARDMVGLGQALGNMTQGVVNGSDLYRAALVQAVASLDSYMHGVMLDRSVDILMGRAHVGSGRGIGLPLHAISDLLATAVPADRELRVRTHLAQRFSVETYQKADSISAALSSIGTAKLWTTAFGPDAETTRTELNLIVERRNRIVHSCDTDTLNPGQLTQISASDALEAVEQIQRIVTEIDKLIS